MPSAQYLLDTNIVSDLIRNPKGVIAKRIKVVGESTVCTSVIVASELRFGAVKHGSPTLLQRVELVLSLLPIAPLEPPADVHYGEIRWQLEQAGTPIGPNDLLIAAQAKSLGLTLVTANDREFHRVPGLGIENWLGR